MAAAVQYYGTGRRKTSTARVFLRPGNGTLTINRRTFEAFFPTEALRTQIKAGVHALERGEFVEIDDSDLDSYLVELTVAPGIGAR